MIEIRPLVESDELQWRKLWRGYLTFYRESLDEAVIAHTWKRLLAGAPYHALVAARGEKLLGFAHLLFHPSTWSTEDYCYLEDLFVDARARGAGAGRALIEAVYTEADRRRLTRVYWHTDAGNAAARGLYDKLAQVTDFVQYRR